MTEDQDNAGDVVAATVRVALTAAGQFAEQAARRREAQLREAERDSAARVATLQSQLAAERELALRSVQDVLRRGSSATAEEVTHAWQQARSWNDPVAIGERDRLNNVIRDRFGVDADSLVAHGDPKRAAAAHTEVTGRDAPTAAALLTRDTERQINDDAQHRGSPATDRVAAITAHLQDAGVDADAAQARALAAQSHPTSPALAAQRPASAPKASRRIGRRATGVEVQSPGR